MLRILATALFTLSLVLKTEALTAQQGSLDGIVGFGVPLPVGAVNDYVAPRFAFSFGLSYGPPEGAWSVRLDGGYHTFNIDNQAVIEHFGGTGGNARTTDIGLAFELGTPKKNTSRFYLITGAGAEVRRAQVTEPDYNPIDDCYWDPLWGQICNSGPPTDPVASSTIWALGLNGGVGASVRMSQRGPSVFAEVRYRIGFTKDEENATGNQAAINTTVLPIVVGIRW